VSNQADIVRQRHWDRKQRRKEARRISDFEAIAAGAREMDNTTCQIMAKLAELPPPLLCGMDRISRDGKCNRPATHVWQQKDGTLTYVCNRCVLSVLVNGGALVSVRRYRNTYGRWADPTQPCEDCDGTGTVHSHNPTCPTCDGTGHKTEWPNARLDRQEEAR
jgi:hypothetical protein